MWQAFPAGSGSTDRTTYMFTYVDAQPGCPKVEDLLEDYWSLMPEYQVIVEHFSGFLTNCLIFFVDFPFPLDRQILYQLIAIYHFTKSYFFE